MVLVLFEVVVKKEGLTEYLSLAAGLRGELERSKGYIRSERFKSLASEGKILSLSVWENEGAVDAWRNLLQHRLSQQRGRNALIESYTITVASKIRSYTLTNYEEAPEDSKVFFGERASGSGPEHSGQAC